MTSTPSDKGILIVTQVVDIDHPVLGFFHRWIEEFAKHYAKVNVICLQEGTHTLPKNVWVHSLGKEQKKGRLVRIWRFYRYIFSVQKEYDHVFVHMNQIYVILGGLLWRTWRKKIGLWYMHGHVPFSLRMAEKITHHIFTGSKESFRLSSKKKIVTSHGIDTDRFKPDPTIQKDIDLITVGRISRSKNLVAQIELLQTLRKERDVSLTIVGKTITPDDETYVEELQQEIKKRALEMAVHFYGPIANKDLPMLLNRAKVFLHTAQNGSLDKSILEAMACGVFVVSSAEGVVPTATSDNFTERIKTFLATDQNQVLEENQKLVAREHSLKHLIPKIITKYGV